MRRNMPMPSRAQGGPLMTDHLHIQDLDLELELLRRKREMIEKQQRQIMNDAPPFNRPSRPSRPRPFDYNDQPFQGLQPFNNGPHFPRFNEPPQERGFGGGGLLGKRPMPDQPWQSGPSIPKRFPGPQSQSGPKRKFNSGPRPHQPDRSQGPHRLFPQQNHPQWNKQQPPKANKPNFPSQRFNNPKTANRPGNRDFKPNKVTKPKQAVQNKKPPAQQAKQVMPNQARKVDEKDPSFVLREDVVPSQQLAGRLELALGLILKEIKTSYGNSEPHTVSFQSMYLQRQMKQAIRERLRSMMMGKYVGKAAVIVESYRKVYPVETDAEIVQIALDAQRCADSRKLAIKLENAGHVYKYIKFNINRLAGACLDDMFDKVQTLYEKENPVDICEKILELGYPKGPNIFESKEGEPEANLDDSDEKDTLQKDDNEQENEEVEDAGNLGENLNNKSIGAVDAGETVKDQSTDSDIGGENGNEQSLDAENDNENEEKPTVEENNEQGESNKTDNVKDQTGTWTAKQETTPAQRLDNLILALLRRRLPYILPRYKTVIHKLLSTSGTFQTTKNSVYERALEKFKKDHVEEEQQGDTSVNASAFTPTRGPLIATYMVKILGKPALPKRKLMQEFLNEFKPTSVKKHRNLPFLFVGFENKEDFDKIVAVKESTIGTSTIHIKVNEKVKPDESLNVSTDSAVLPSELDEQINDLLSSIRKEDENPEPAPQVKSEDVTKDTETKVNGGEVDEKDATPQLNSSVKTEESSEEKAENTVEGEAKIDGQEKDEAKDKVEELKAEVKETGRATPTRASSRLASVTPCSVRTRRASRLANN